MAALGMLQQIILLTLTAQSAGHRKVRLQLTSRVWPPVTSRVWPPVNKSSLASADDSLVHAQSICFKEW